MSTYGILKSRKYMKIFVKIKYERSRISFFSTNAHLDFSYCIMFLLENALYFIQQKPCQSNSVKTQTIGSSSNDK